MSPRAAKPKRPRINLPFYPSTEADAIGAFQCHKRSLDPKEPRPVGSGFQELPLDQIGLIQDEYRATWPVVHAVRGE